MSDKREWGWLYLVVVAMLWLALEWALNGTLLGRLGAAMLLAALYLLPLWARGRRGE